MTGIFDPDRPPCPWCLVAFSIRQALYHDKNAYCPHCRRLVFKYLSHEGVQDTYGWYWGKPREGEYDVR